MGVENEANTKINQTPSPFRPLKTYLIKSLHLKCKREKVFLEPRYRISPPKTTHLKKNFVNYVSVNIYTPRYPSRSVVNYDLFFKSPVLPSGKISNKRHVKKICGELVKMF